MNEGQKLIKLSLEAMHEGGKAVRKTRNDVTSEEVEDAISRFKAGGGIIKQGPPPKFEHVGRAGHLDTRKGYRQ